MLLFVSGGWKNTARLNIVYNGGLALDEYVLLIENSCWARSHKFEFPVSIDRKKLNAGIRLRIDEIKGTLPESRILFSVISAEQRPNFTDEEWGAYELISDFALGDGLTFYRNKKLYVDKMGELGTSAFLLIQNKRYDVFDEEMARATEQALEQENNAGKNQFVSDFKKIWIPNVQSSDMRLEDSIRGFESLKTHLEKSLSEVSQEQRSFSTVHTERFVEAISELIDICENEMSQGKKPQETQAKNNHNASIRKVGLSLATRNFI